MKKIILSIFLFLFFVPVFVFAAVAGDDCTSLDNSKPEGCPSEKANSPEGLKCNIAVNYESKPINKCVDLRNNIVPVKIDIQEGEKGVYCLTDENCKESSSGTKAICNQAEWMCMPPTSNRMIHCVRDLECTTAADKGYYCNQEDHFCTERKEKKIYEPCDMKTDYCENFLGRVMLECFPISKDKGECRLKRGTGEKDWTCSVTSECKEGYYCTPASGLTKGVCTLKLAPTSPCSLNEQCSDGYCADANGVALSEGGKAPGTCVSGAKEDQPCSAIAGSTKKCASGLICTGVNEQTGEGTCTKSTLETRESLDQKIAREEANRLSMTNQLNQYCSAKHQKGTFTQDVSYACLNCGNCEARDIMAVIARVFNFAFTIIGSLAVLGTIISGIMYILSHGNQEKAEGAKKALTATITGLVIVALAYFLINTIMTLLGYNCGSWFDPNFTCLK